MPEGHGDGSCVVVVATDAPLLPHQARRLAVRAGLGLARCGSTAYNGSGELMIAFSTANRLPLESPGGLVELRAVLDGATGEDPGPINDLFEATVDAVEESVVNALFIATTTTGRDGNVLHALPLGRTLEIRALRASAAALNPIRHRPAKARARRVRRPASPVPRAAPSVARRPRMDIDDSTERGGSGRSAPDDVGPADARSGGGRATPRSGSAPRASRGHPS
jgi:hypothetical protein